MGMFYFVLKHKEPLGLFLTSVVLMTMTSLNKLHKRREPLARCYVSSGSKKGTDFQTVVEIC